MLCNIRHLGGLESGRIEQPFDCLLHQMEFLLSAQALEVAKDTSINKACFCQCNIYSGFKRSLCPVQDKNYLSADHHF